MTKPLKFSDAIITRRTGDREATLVCPRCGSSYLHQGEITIFDRAEDAASILKTTANTGKTLVEHGAVNAGNPSSRRDGMFISFDCEGCGKETLQLTIAQHKGETLIGWRFAETK